MEVIEQIILKGFFFFGKWSLQVEFGLQTCHIHSFTEQSTQSSFPLLAIEFSFKKQVILLKDLFLATTENP